MTEKKEEYLRPDGGYGWVIVGSIIFINISLLTLVQHFGIIYEDEFKTMGITAAQISSLLHLHNSIFCIFGLFMSPLLKKYSFRIIALVGAILMCFGILCSSFAQSYEALIVSISIFIGIGQGILMPATYLATNTYFKEKLTIAVSISATGAGLAPVFMPTICVKLLKHYGRQTTVLVLFAISLISIPCCLLLKPLAQPVIEKMIPKETETKEDTIYNETTVKTVQHNGFLKKLADMFDMELLKQRTFVLVVIVLGISFASELNLILMMQFILPELATFNKPDVAIAMTCQYVADILGRLLLPLMAHYLKVPSKVSYSMALIIASLARTGMVMFKDSYYTIIVLCVIIGLTKGCRAVFQSVIIPKVVAYEKYAVATGINMFYTGIISLIVGPIIGEVHDLTKSYVYSLHLESVISVSCVLIWLLEWIFYLRKEEREKNLDETIEIS